MGNDKIINGGSRNGISRQNGDWKDIYQQGGTQDGITCEPSTV